MISKIFNERAMTNRLKELRQTLLYLTLVSILLVGCSVARQSQFNSQSVVVGMDKKDVNVKFGTPYKTGFHDDTNQVSYEDWYYKENLFIKKWYEVTTILHFKNNKLVSMEPGEEAPLYKGYGSNSLIR